MLDTPERLPFSRQKQERRLHQLADKIARSLLVKGVHPNAVRQPRETVLYRQSTGPNPLYYVDDFSRPALRHGSWNFFFKVALYLPSYVRVNRISEIGRFGPTVRVGGLQGGSLRSTTSQKCEAVPRRARIEGAWTCVSLNSRLQSNWRCMSDPARRYGPVTGVPRS